LKIFNFHAHWCSLSLKRIVNRFFFRQTWLPFSLFCNSWPTIKRHSPKRTAESQECFVSLSACPSCLFVFCQLIIWPKILTLETGMSLEASHWKLSGGQAVFKFSVNFRFFNTSFPHTLLRDVKLPSSQSHYKFRLKRRSLASTKQGAKMVEMAEMSEKAGRGRLYWPLLAA